MKGFSTSAKFLLLVFIMSLTPLCQAKMLNVAYGKPAVQSSTIDKEISTTGVPSYAVDGVMSTSLSTCTFTKETTLTWWYVDLLRVYNISSIGIMNRKNKWERLANFSLEVSAEDPRDLRGFPGSTHSCLCAVRLQAVPPETCYNTSCLQVCMGRYVRVVKYNTEKDQRRLHLCEVVVMARVFPYLEKQEHADGPAVILETFEGRTSIECGRLCLRLSVCRFIQYKPYSSTCRLLKSFNQTAAKINKSTTLYKVVQL